MIYIFHFSEPLDSELEYIIRVVGHWEKVTTTEKCSTVAADFDVVVPNRNSCFDISYEFFMKNFNFTSCTATQCSQWSGKLLETWLTRFTQSWLCAQSSPNVMWWHWTCMHAFWCDANYGYGKWETYIEERKSHTFIDQLSNYVECDAMRDV